MTGPTQLLIPPQLHVDGLNATDQLITILAHPTSLTAACPTYRLPSHHLHSHYERVLADVPWCGIPLCLRVTVRRFRCRNPSCPQRIFAERLDDIAAIYARRTDRVSSALELIGFALSGEAGARLANHLGFVTSPDTLLRVIRSIPDPTEHPLTICRVDDWAWRRGHRYGTILVDLERHRVVDVLPRPIGGVLRSLAPETSWHSRHQSRSG